ncbi:MAG: ribonuclease HII [Desulfovibrionaceae bacterium]|nr:ribonuclease HII [Desulfovibrionaceae bacterium]
MPAEAPEESGLWIIGVDEAGRGCLAGPVSAAAVLAPPGYDFSVFAGLADSKKLSAGRRNHLERAIRESGLIWGFGQSWPTEIDRVNILNATFRAMSRAVQSAARRLFRRLSRQTPSPEEMLLYIDGPFTIPMEQWLGAGRHFWTDPPEQRPLVRGDALMPAISAASILAKTQRDRLMLALHRRFPAYGLDRHKGYATASHMEKLAECGPSPLHRKSFSVRDARLAEQGTLI